MEGSLRQFAAEVIETEAAALRTLRVDERFDKAVRLNLDCTGAVLTSGIGKAGHVARKLSASFSSTGTPSHFLNPAEALHGDLGSVRKGDVVLILSYSGESDEILRMLSVIKTLGHPVIAVTSTTSNALARYSDVVLELGRVEEACPLGLAPSTSTTAMLVLGDALFLAVMKARHFTADDFAIYHPAGQLGRKLIRVREAMSFAAGDNLPVVSDRLTVGRVLHDASAITSSLKRSAIARRRSGAVVLIDDSGKISGIFTDGDLRRLITDDDGSALQRPVKDVMTANPRRINGERLASEAMAVMRPLRIDDLPVVDDADRPIGLIDIQDLVVLRMLDVEPR